MAPSKNLQFIIHREPSVAFVTSSNGVHRAVLQLLLAPTTSFSNGTGGMTMMQDDPEESSSPTAGGASAAKVALVTGAGSGIGRASSQAMYRAGYSLVIAGRHLETLRETAQTWDGDRCLVVVADISDQEDVQELFSKTFHRFGRLDVLFNNAGIGSPPAPIDEIIPQLFQQVMNVNVTGTFLCSQQAWKLMKESGRGGRIINNGSISAHTPRPLSLPYTTAKHAITGLTKSLNLDGRSFKICSSQIDIGNAATPMTERLSTAGALQPNGDTIKEPTMPVELVAETVVYLANLPLEANVPFITIMATQMPYMGRG